jgi:diguanylate cyclase (GGDEF)-like protein
MNIAPHLLLTAYILLTHSLTAAMWLIGGRWMGLSRRAASDWLRASLANGFALLLMVGDGGLPHPWLVMLAGTLAILGAASLRRGLKSFLRLPHAKYDLLRLVAAAAAFNLVLCAPMAWTSLGLSVSCLVVAVLMLLCARETHAVIATEFRPGTAWSASALLSVGALLFVLTGATSVASHTGLATPIPSAELRQVVIVFATSLLSIMIAFVLGYIVVMRLVNRLQHLSQRDSLTGLLNRRAFEHALARETHRLQRFGETFSILLLDIDHFKRINDMLGHAAGDAVLCQVAQTLMAQAREVDRVARYGGEEFCVLLPHTEHEGAMQAAERLRAAVQANTVVWRDDKLIVTISIGVACAVEPEEPLDTLLRRADIALYRAKTEGRNRVVPAALSAP